MVFFDLFLGLNKQDEAIWRPALMLHRVREILVRRGMMLSTALRAHLAELGVISRNIGSNHDAIFEAHLRI